MELMTHWNGCAIYLHQGDITELKLDAIVNAANQDLRAGSGVCGAIHRRGGPVIAQECNAHVARHGPVPVGQAALTSGGNLPAQHVIHAVGPIYDDDPGKAPELLAAAYRHSLALARDHGLKSIAFPCISTGVYGYPPDEACEVATRAVQDDLLAHNALEQVVFCTFGPADHERYARALRNG